MLIYHALIYTFIYHALIYLGQIKLYYYYLLFGYLFVLFIIYSLTERIIQK